MPVCCCHVQEAVACVWVEDGGEACGGGGVGGVGFVEGGEGGEEGRS